MLLDTILNLSLFLLPRNSDCHYGIQSKTQREGGQRFCHEAHFKGIEDESQPCKHRHHAQRQTAQEQSQIG